MSQHLNIRLSRVCLLLIAVLTAVWAGSVTTGARVSSRTAHQANNQEVSVLELNRAVKGELPVGESRSYQVRLEANTYVLFEVFFYQEAATVELYNSKGELVYRQWREPRPVSGGFRQRLNRVAEASDTYRLVLRANAGQKSPTSYELKIVELRPATEGNRMLQAAEAQQSIVSRLLSVEGKFDEAIALGESVLATYLKFAPPDYGDIGNLGMVLHNAYAERGYHRDLERREQILEICAQNREAMFGKNNLHVAILYEWLAEISDPVRADKWYQQAMDIVVALQGPKHSYVASVLGSWGTVVEALGDKQRAANMYKQAVQMMEETEGPEYHMICAPLINHGQVLMDKREWAAAETCFQRVLSIVEKNPVGTHMEGDPVGLALYSLAELHHRKGDFAQAAAYQQKLLQYRQAASLLPHHPAWAMVYQQMGNHALARGKYDDAAKYFGDAQKVLEMTGDSPLLASLLRDWRKLHLLTGRINDAIAVQRRAVEISETELRRLLAYGSEREKMKVLSLAANEMTETLSLHVEAAPKVDQALRLAFTTLLQRKGRALDEMNRTIAFLRSSAGSESSALFERWINKASQISALASKTSENETPASQLARIGQINREFEELQSAIGKRNPEFRAQILPPVTIEDVHAALPADSALIEFAKYEPTDTATKKSGQSRYLAYVLPKTGSPQGVDLGEAAKIDAAVRMLRRAIGDKNFRVDPRPLARKVDELVMRRIRPLLGGAKTIFVAPDGELNLVPFPALRDDSGKYLIEDFLFIYLTSGRDLLRLQIKHQSQPDKMIFAVNDFDGQVNVAPSIAQAGSGVHASSDARDTRGGRLSKDETMATLRFPRLAHAREEGEAVRRIVPEAKLLLDAQAIETTLKQVHRPYFLHLATHGFFLANASQKWENPLLRSGLALAGANARKSGNDDGILTAFEVAALDLWGTQLVVLSACDTGNGDVKNGEGVFGLRRALVLAGAETQVSSLWRADDEATQKLMQDFYRNLNAKMGRAEALQQAQLKMLRAGVFLNPYYWANFICIGEWKPLNQ